MNMKHDLRFSDSHTAESASNTQMMQIVSIHTSTHIPFKLENKAKK